MKILEIFGGNRLEFIGKSKIIEIWWMISIGQIKQSYSLQNLARLDQKWVEFWKISRKFWDFFDQNLYGKLTFSQFFTKYFSDFWLRSESIDLWKITPDFYNNLSYFEGGTFRRSPPPPDSSVNGLISMTRPVTVQYLAAGLIAVLNPLTNKGSLAS